MNGESTTTQLTLLSPTEVWDRVDPLFPDLHADPAVMGLGALPYQALRGPGFERLCYELLVAEGHSPRFFGRSGQPDYGVDLVVETDTKRAVYQCKNLTEAPAWTEIREAITKFEDEWLGEAGLPHVDSFVYCCPHPLDDRSLAEEWTRFKDDFQRRTEVEISFLDRHGLDALLRRLPDLVAGLFSNSYAEHFCGRDGWLDGPWIRLKQGEARHASIARFLDRHQRGTIHIPEDIEERFRDLLSNSPVAVIRGLPGSGKTFTGLELVSQMRDPIRRIYYATLGRSTDPERLWQSVRRRSSLPAVFVLDDCHFDLEKAGFVLERLVPELSDSKGRVKLLLILRDSVGSSGQLDDTPDWLLRLSQDLRIIELDTGLERTRAVTLHLRPELAGLSRQRLERLHYTSGGDLLLLDEALSNVSSPQDLDMISPDTLYGSLRSRYFGGNRRLPTVQKLACLAQFELVPLASFLDAGWLPGEKELVAPLMTELFAPPRYQFLHSSLAELVLRALMSLERIVVRIEEGVAETTVTTLVAFLKHLLASNSSGVEGQSWFMAALETILHGRLKLTEGPEEARIKAAVLADETIRSAIELNLNHCTFTLLHICVVVLSIADHPLKSRYADLIVRRISMLFQSSRPDAAAMATVGKGFFTLARNAPSSLQAVEKTHGADGFLRLITTHGTLSQLFGVLQYATPTFRSALLDQLDEAYVGALVGRTITSGQSIGALHFAMRELGNADAVLLERLEIAIGAERFLRLITANGTLFELFRLLNYATPAFRLALLERLDESYVRVMVDRAISGRSFDTLGITFTMRELGKTDRVLLERLETVIGAERFLHLIAANGTLFDLFGVLQYATPAFRLALLDRFDEAYARAIVDKTIASGRYFRVMSITFTMRELGDADSVLLRRLEMAVGAERFLRLIAANGGLVELFKILEYATPALRLTLLDRFDETFAKALVDRNIASGRSIGTLGLTMRGLGDADPVLLDRLELVIGAERFLRLIAANGGLVELFKILEYATPVLRLALLGRLDDAYARTLVDKNIASRRSIGTLSLAIRELADADSVLERLETAIGVEHFLRLITANGTLVELFEVLKHVTSAFRLSLLNRLDEASTGALVNKTIAVGRSISSLHFTLGQSNRDPAQRGRLEELVGIAGWWMLVAEVGTLNSLSSICHAMTDNFREPFIQASSDITVAQWCGIIVRGLFLNAFRFVTDEYAAYPLTSQAAFREALGQTAASLAAKATWFDLNPSRVPANPNSLEERILREVLQPRIERLHVEDLLGLEFREAINGFAFGWRERPDLRGALGERLWDIVPAEWPREEGEVAVLRFMLNIARSDEVSLPDANRLLESVTSFLDRDVCAEMHTLPLFLLLWNMAALHYERRANRGFDRVLPDSLIEILGSILRGRVQPKGPNQEKLAQFALGGLLGFLVPRLGKELRHTLAPLAKSTQWLRPLALEQTFVPALFCLEGLALLYPEEDVFTPLVCYGLLAKSEEYDQVGPAIEYLRERVKRYGKQPQTKRKRARK